MLGKKALRLVTAAVLATGVSLGAGHVSGATAHHAAANAGSIVITDWQTPDGCGPGYGGTVVDVEVCAPVLSYAGLFNLDNHATYIPDIASYVPTLKNGGAKIVGGNIVVTYKIKPNLKWSDGQPITMNDWKFSVALNLLLGNTFGIDQIKSIQVVNPLTAIVTMNGKYSTFVENAQPTFLLPQHYLEQKYKSTNLNTIAAAAANDLYNSPSDVVSGPYKIKSFASDGSSVVLEPNPYYSAQPGPSGHQRLAEIKYINIASTAADLAAALASGKAGVDKAEDFQFDNVPLLQSSKYHFNAQPSIEFEHLELNSSAGSPLHDVRVRQALQYALDKRAMFHFIFPGVKGNIDQFLLHTVIPNVSPWSDKSLPVSDYNPAKAKALLQAAGYSTNYNGPHPLRVNFVTTRTQIRQHIGQAVAAFWAQVGVHTVQNYIPGSGNNGLFSAYANNGVLKHLHFDVADFAFSIPPDPQAYEQNFDPSVIPTATKHGALDQNYTSAGGDQFALLKQARYTTDNAQRHAILNRWQHVIHDQAYWIMLYNRANITVDDGRIGNFLPNPTSQGNEWNAYQFYAQ